jgi:hypothetical protein
MTYIYIYIGRQDGSGARGRGQPRRGGGHADWSGHGGGAVAGRERLPRLGRLCVCVYVCMCAGVYVGSEGGM